MIGLLIAIASTGQIPSTAKAERPAAELLTGSQFSAEIAKPLSGTWSNVELRAVLRKIAVEHRVAILIDRRIDPNVLLPIDIVNRPLRDGLQDIADRVAGRVSVPENVVFIGPQSAADRLRTLIELRLNELKSVASAIPERRQKELTKRRHVEWHDLDTPAEILQRIAEHDRLAIRRIELVPHDLWAGTSLPSVTAAEALSLVLIQFDLTFAWIDSGVGVELVPIPAHVAVERRHRAAKGRSAADALQLVRQQSSDLDAQLSGSELLVRGTVEDHEAVMAILNPSTVKKPAEVSRPTPLKQRLFTWKVQRVPARALMKKLEESQVVFDYDAAALKSAGIDLDQPVDLELEKASADELFKTVFAPLGLSFEIDHLTVKLTPKK